MQDAEFLLKLKNQADVRKFSIVSKGRILMKNHVKWLEKTLMDPEVEFWLIVEGSKSPIGDVRIDRNEISIRIISSFQGKKVGTKTIKTFTKHGMTAKIVEGNIKSMRTFIKCGYRPTEYAKGVYTFEYD